MFTSNDKRCSLQELVSQIENGDCLAVGGGLSSREPMAALRELIRQGIDDLTVVGSAHGIDIDMLSGAGMISKSKESYVGFEQDFGLPPNYRRACESEQIKSLDSCCYTLVQQLKATIAGIPFMPMRSIRGTSMMELHPEYKTIKCPYTQDELVLVPAIQPDVTLIHAQYADIHGNLVIEGPPVVDILFAKASKKVLVTVEKIISTDELQKFRISVPYFYVTHITEVRFGAHPTACYPFYAYDRKHTAHYYHLAQDDQTFLESYLKTYVYACTNHNDYLKAVGGDLVLNKLADWCKGTKQWQAIYE